MLSIYYGDDDFTPEEAIRAARAELGDPTIAELNYSALDGARLRPDELVQATQAMPFLGLSRLVVVRRLLTRFGSGQRGGETVEEADAEGAAPEADRARSVWQAWMGPLTQTPPSTHLILWDVGRLAGNPLLKALMAAPGVTAREFKPPANRELESWIAARGQRRQARLAPAAVRRLADLLGDDLRRLDVEIEKLATYAAGGSVDEAVVDLLITADREAAIWNLTDPIVARRGTQAIQALHALLAGGWAPAQVLFAIAGQFRRLLLAQALLDRRAPTDEIRRVCNLRSDFALRKTVDQARAYRAADLERAYFRLLAADVQTKTGRLDATLALELLIQDLCGTPVRR
ncbi:MAG: DNA polymerase III subunit delta [Chloroflexi bacterium]|nr:DNA polymerase III subunit delta [Chloroflexota bacterium]